MKLLIETYEELIAAAEEMAARDDVSIADIDEALAKAGSAYRENSKRIETATEKLNTFPACFVDSGLINAADTMAERGKQELAIYACEYWELAADSARDLFEIEA